MSDQTPTPPTAPAAAPAATPPAAPPVEPVKAPAAAAAPVAPATPEPAPDAPKTPPKADAWAKLSAQEKRVRADREKVEARAKELAEQEKALSATRERAALIDRAKAGDWEAREKLLAESGVTYDDLTKRKLSGGKVDKGEEALKELERLKAEMAERESKAKQEFEENTVAQNLDACVTHASQEASADYPVLAGEIAENPEWVNTVMRAGIAGIVKNGGRDERGNPMTVKDACKRLEDHLRTEAEKRIARIKPPPAPTPPPVAEETKTSNETRPRDQAGRFAGGGGPRRLTNEVSAERSSSALPKSSERARPKTQRERDIEERERLQRAAAAMPRR